jgi:hypothetical protein
MKFPPIQALQVLPDFCLQARFDDGSEVMIRFADTLQTPIMRPLNTPEEFAKVRIDSSRAFIYWDIDVPAAERPDASSDWLYLQRFSQEEQRAFEKMLEQGVEWQFAAKKLMDESLS